MKRTFTVLLTAVAWLLPLSAAAQAARRVFKMDFDWRFTLGDPPDAEKPNLDDGRWRALDVPHDWSIEGPWDRSSPSGPQGGFAPIGIGWYRKHFRLPSDSAGKRVLLGFDGVFNHADVWVNGQKVGHNDNGYIGFECDLTPWVRPDRDNVIAVRADDLKQASRWYTGSGIYRHVWLTVTGPLHVAHWGTYITTPQVSDAQATVVLQTALRNDSDEPRTGTLVTRILAPNGNEAATLQTPFGLAPRTEQTLEQRFTVRSPEYWTLEKPRLYTAASEVRAGPEALDGYRTPFGIRTVRFDVDHGFLLNGKRVVIKGVCLHADLGALGTASLEAGYAARLKTLQTIGVNAIRLSHNPHTPELLDLADRMGLLVFDEAFDKWYGFEPDGTGWKHDLAAMLQRDRNHPSIFLWSVGNEMTPHMYLREGTLLYRAMQALVHDVEPTRPVTAALHPVRNQKGERDAPLAELASDMDVISMNYQTRWYARDHQQHPKQVFLGSETHLHQVDLDAPRAAQDDSGNQWWGTRDFKSGEYFPYVAGQFIWAGVDYLGESGGWPSKGFHKGLVATTGERSPWSYFFQSLYTDDPMVYIAVRDPGFKADPRRDAGAAVMGLRADWNLPADVTTARVYTFSNAPTTELLLNSKSLGEKRAQDFADHIILWDVPNQPGRLTAIAKQDGKVVARHELETAGAPVHLRLVPDRSELEATGQDLSLLSVEAVDAQGRVSPLSRDVVRFHVTGDGKLAGVDNGDLDSPEPYQAEGRELRHGRALAIVQSLRRAGTIHVVAHAEGLQDAALDIPVNAPAVITPAIP